MQLKLLYLAMFDFMAFEKAFYVIIVTVVHSVLSDERWISFHVTMVFRRSDCDLRYPYCSDDHSKASAVMPLRLFVC